MEVILFRVEFGTLSRLHMIGVRTNVTYRTNGQFYNKIPPNTSLVVAVQKHLQHARTTEYITKRAFTNTTHVICRAMICCD